MRKLEEPRSDLQVSGSDFAEESKTEDEVDLEDFMPSGRCNGDEVPDPSELSALCSRGVTENIGLEARIIGASTPSLARQVPPALVSDAR